MEMHETKKRGNENTLKSTSVTISDDTSFSPRNNENGKTENNKSTNNRKKFVSKNNVFLSLILCIVLLFVLFVYEIVNWPRSPATEKTVVVKKEIDLNNKSNFDIDIDTTTRFYETTFGSTSSPTSPATTQSVNDLDNTAEVTKEYVDWNNIKIISTPPSTQTTTENDPYFTLGSSYGSPVSTDDDSQWVLGISTTNSDQEWTPTVSLLSSSFYKTSTTTYDWWPTFPEYEDSTTEKPHTGDYDEGSGGYGDDLDDSIGWRPTKFFNRY